jgi:ADP-heptose:LPS heptosyltransferase
MILKKILKYLVYYGVIFLTPLKKRVAEKSLVIIRLDAIGDYLLFRNFLLAIKESEQYRNYHVTLVGNSSYKELAQELDSKYIDKFIWINRSLADSSFLYLYQKLKELASLRYDILLAAPYSREFFYTDSLARLISANDKVAIKVKSELMSQKQQDIGDRYYTKLVTLSSNRPFEFYRNKEFFEKFLNEELAINEPFIKRESKLKSFDLPLEYIVLFIGASARFRKWDIKKFVKIGQTIEKRNGYKIVLAGGPSDISDALEFEGYYCDEFINLVGKTSLVELLDVLDSSKMIVSNETSAPHFAYALGVKRIIVISNGNHYGRFTPYPKEMTNRYHVLYPPQIEMHLDDEAYLIRNYSEGSSLDINTITVESVLEKIDEIFQESKA